MHDTSLPRNRHPVDQLADIRAQIKALQELETDLKAQISTEMGSRVSLGGDQFIARRVGRIRKGGLDEEAMKRRGIKVDNYRKPPVKYVVIEVEPRVMEVA